jgi:hypothetical protein
VKDVSSQEERFANVNQDTERPPDVILDLKPVGLLAVGRVSTRPDGRAQSHGLGSVGESELAAANGEVRFTQSLWFTLVGRVPAKDIDQPFISNFAAARRGQDKQAQ